MRYATALAASPEATYRAVDLAGRTGGEDASGLVGLLYVEAVRALRAAAAAAEHRRYAIRSERVTRALAILFALESGLDYDAGGDLAATLARVYRQARQQVIDASLGDDGTPLLAVATTIEEIGLAWESARRSR